MPAVFGRIKKYHKLIEKMILSTSTDLLKENWCVNEISNNRIKQWCELVAIEAKIGGIEYMNTIEILEEIFKDYFYNE